MLVKGLLRTKIPSSFLVHDLLAVLSTARKRMFYQDALRSNYES